MKKKYVTVKDSKLSLTERNTDFITDHDNTLTAHHCYHHSDQTRRNLDGRKCIDGFGTENQIQKNSLKNARSCMINKQKKDERSENKKDTA